MRIHDRYILKQFWRNVAIGIVAFVVIYVTVDVNENIDDYIDHHAAFLDVASYYIFMVPWILVLISPVAVLLSTIFSFGKLSRDNELTAFIASGVSLVRIALPVIVSAFMVSLIILGMNELVVPKTNRAAGRVKTINIEKKREKRSKRFKMNFHYQGENNWMYYAQRYDIKLKTLTEAVVQKYNGSNLVKRIDARRGVWDGSKWVFLNGAVREFDQSGEKVEPFKKLEMPELRERPEDFSKEEIDPEDMNYAQLKNYIDKLRRGGGPVDKYLVDLHFKFSFPFISLIFAVIGVALSSAKMKPSMSTGFGMTLMISFTYYGILRIGQALGHSGVIQPFLGAWIGNLIFLVVGVVLLYRANR